MKIDIGTIQQANGGKDEESDISIMINDGASTEIDTEQIVGSVRCVQETGPKLLEECLKIRPMRKIRCPVGEARITLAGDLPSRYVIHAVGPKYHREENPAQLLAAAYISSLKLALDNSCESIAFPAISCGSYGYPIREAAKVALQVCSDSKFKEIDIYFYLYGQKNYGIWQSVLDSKNI